jgi:hypothetical protein
VYAAPGAPGFVPPSAGTAKTLVLVALILGIIFGLIYIVGIGLSFLFIAAACSGLPGCGGIPIFDIVFLSFGVIAFIFIFLIWLLIYKPIGEGKYESARSMALIFTILSFVTLNIITGILLLIAYLKLGDAVRETQMPAAGYYPPGGAPMMGAPVAAPPPMTMGTTPPAAPAGPAPNCPKCGRPATWVAQYSRYYCYTDNQYV